MPKPSKPNKHVIMIGAADGMGLWAARHWFAELDDVARVTLCDVEPLSDKALDALSNAPASIEYVRAEYSTSGLSLVDRKTIDSASNASVGCPELSKADLVVLAVPLSAIGVVMDGLNGHLATDAWLIDMSSAKTAPLAHMVKLAGPGVAVAGTHPLFGITGDSITDKTVALVPTQTDDGSLIRWLDGGLQRLGAITMNVTAERHDRYMLIAQTMTHFALMAFGDAVTSSLQGDESLEELRQFGTPPYLAMGAVTGRLLTQNHRLYASIQQTQGAKNIREVFAESAQRLADSFAEGSLDDIEVELDGLADRYGADELSISTRLSEELFRAGRVGPEDDLERSDS
ncbi:MAG TPA: prephenate dehydrogenase/arogenate dehydrogenase family protein [Dehalococcoidia bacterium]|nr:prephenate dehydrogenase/arogenate dehydrogenase family protein [Dehalococcoidia bacterium]